MWSFPLKIPSFSSLLCISPLFLPSCTHMALMAIKPAHPSRTVRDPFEIRSRFARRTFRDFFAHSQNVHNPHISYLFTIHSHSIHRPLIDPLRPFETFWAPAGPFWTFWDFLGPSRTHFGFRGIYWYFEGGSFIFWISFKIL